MSPGGLDDQCPPRSAGGPRRLVGFRVPISGEARWPGHGMGQPLAPPGQGPGFLPESQSCTAHTCQDRWPPAYDWPRLWGGPVLRPTGCVPMARGPGHEALEGLGVPCCWGPCGPAVPEFPAGPGPSGRAPCWRRLHGVRPPCEGPASWFLRPPDLAHAHTCHRALPTHVCMPAHTRSTPTHAPTLGPAHHAHTQRSARTRMHCAHTKLEEL